MLAGKIFFEAIKYQSQSHVNLKTGSIFKLNLILNDIYYDQLKQFHTKYLCLTTTDLLNLELFDQSTQTLIGVTNINDVYKLIQEQRSIQIQIHNSQMYGDLVLLLSFQPVTASKKRKNISPIKPKPSSSFVKSPQRNPKTEEMYSQKQNLTYVHEENDSQSKSSINRADKALSSILNSNEKLQRVQSQSIQSLAQQRQKILGQLFGKFKRQR